ncbi:hypothetical protein [uncultured Tateyamaria sp.]|uniref:hypothetical protein n=1 Tax=uncultured Tateyamaria sp. TaxID=455651 RepID=UPI002610A8C2|nr:hypothetical protein [uncultured Tateyamaria sp.]
MSAPIAKKEFRIDPSRFESGTWCHKRDKIIGEGDIAASYSADKIGLEGAVRKPFKWQNAMWVNTGMVSNGKSRSVEAYQLIPAKFFDGEPQTYGQIVRSNTAAGQRQEGFYHGMHVQHGKRPYVLIGPSVIFLPSEEETPQQINLLDLL